MRTIWPTSIPTPKIVSFCVVSVELFFFFWLGLIWKELVWFHWEDDDFSLTVNLFFIHGSALGLNASFQEKRPWTLWRHIQHVWWTWESEFWKEQCGAWGQQELLIRGNKAWSGKSDPNRTLASEDVDWDHWGRTYLWCRAQTSGRVWPLVKLLTVSMKEKNCVSERDTLGIWD